MVLRCSLLGHDFGEAEVEREREERGSEVVVTVVEYEECSRCGTRHVISENTEVRSNPSRTTTTPASPDDPEPEPETDDRPAATDDVEPTTPADAAAGPDAFEDDLDVPTDETGEPITDDGEILEDEDEPAEDDRGRGEWPDSDDVGPPKGVENEPAAWPDADDPEAAADTTPADGADEESLDADPIDDAVFVDDESIDGAAFADADPDAAAAAVDDGGEVTGIASDRPAPTPGEGAALEDVPTEFYCPRCDFVASGDRGSLRSGDICPDCRRGYLSERER